MSNPNTTPTFSEQVVQPEQVAQGAGHLAVVSAAEKVHSWTALNEPETLKHWQGFDDKGNVNPRRLSRQGRLKQKEEEAEALRRQAVDVTREENSFLDVA